VVCAYPRIGVHSTTRTVAFRRAATTQGTRCGARRKDGDGYNSLTIDRDNTRFLALTVTLLALWPRSLGTLWPYSCCRLRVGDGGHCHPFVK